MSTRSSPSVSTSKNSMSVWKENEGKRVEKLVNIISFLICGGRKGKINNKSEQCKGHSFHQSAEAVSLLSRCDSSSCCYNFHWSVSHYDLAEGHVRKINGSYISSQHYRRNYSIPRALFFFLILGLSISTAQQCISRN